MAKAELTELEIIEARYAELSHNLTLYRAKYFELQNTYPPESEYLIDQLTRLNAVLDFTKSEIMEMDRKIKAIRTEIAELAKFKKKNIFLRLVG
jgi:predicted  nucleic acid-binding Zn-ribbon protein